MFCLILLVLRGSDLVVSPVVVIICYRTVVSVAVARLAYPCLLELSFYLAVVYLVFFGLFDSIGGVLLVMVLEILSHRPLPFDSYFVFELLAPVVLLVVVSDFGLLRFSVLVVRLDFQVVGSEVLDFHYLGRDYLLAAVLDYVVLAEVAVMEVVV